MPPKRARVSDGTDTAPAQTWRKVGCPSETATSQAEVTPVTPTPATSRAATASSRRKQSKPLRVSTAAAETVDTDAGLDRTNGAAAAVRQEMSAPATPANSTTSLMASLKGRRPVKSKTTERVECGVCHESVCAATFDRHAMSAHNGLARPAGQSQEFDKRQKLSAFRCVLKAGMSLTCPHCSKTLTTNTGFYYHHNQCGNDVKPLQCPKCDQLVRPMSMPTHMRKHERMEGALQSTPETPRRRKCKRLQSSSLEVLSSDDEGKDDPSYEEPKTNGTSRVNKQKTPAKPRATASEQTAWRLQLEEHGSITCARAPCTFVGKNVREMLAHVPDCIGRAARNKQVLYCDHCTKRTPNKEEMLRHLASFHPRVAAAAVSGSSPAGRHRSRIGTVTPDMSSEFTYFTRLERQADPRLVDAHYWRSLPASIALQRVPATECRLAIEEEVTRYSPPAVMSPAYKVQTIGLKDDLRTYERMDAFTAKQLENGVLAFGGGAVSACSWCPAPADDSQLLALSCLPTMDPALPPTQPTSQHCALQLWSFCGISSARLEYCLCVDGGPLLDLAWCPGGRAADAHLGPLAAACADGRVRVYLPPTPGALPVTGHKQCMYLKRPELRLEMYGEAGRSPCARLDWAATDRNRTIAGVFGNGIVAVWDVTTTSPILTERDGCSTVLYPVQVIPAHRGHGTTVLSCPAADRFVVSAGRDRCVHVWDREEPAVVQRAANKLRPMAADVRWPPGSKKLLVAYDHSLFVGSPTVMVCDTSVPVVDVPIVTHGAKATCLSVCAPVNGAAVGSESGLVCLAQWRSMLSHKQKAELRKLLLKVTVKRLTAHATGNTEHSLGDDFGTCWETCGVTVWDAKQGAKGVTKECFDEHTTPSGDWVSNYPFMAVNKVCWNRNKEADSWLAVGMECGFVRVLSVHPGAFKQYRGQSQHASGDAGQRS